MRKKEEQDNETKVLTESK